MIPQTYFNNMTRSEAEQFAELASVTAACAQECNNLKVLSHLGFEQDEDDPDLFWVQAENFYFMVDFYKKTSLASEHEAHSPHPQHDDGREAWGCEFSWR